MKAVKYSFLVFLLLISCKGIPFKDQKIIKSLAKAHLETLYDSVCVKEYLLVKYHVSKFKGSIWDYPVTMVSNESKDTITLTQKTMIKGKDASGIMSKKLVNWKVFLSRSNATFKIDKTSHKVVGNVTFPAQLLKFFLSVLLIFAMTSFYSINNFSEFFSSLYLFLIISVGITLFIGVNIYGSFVLSLLNALFLLFLILSVTSYIKARWAK